MIVILLRIYRGGKFKKVGSDLKELVYRGCLISEKASYYHDES